MATAEKTHRPVPKTPRSKPGSYMARPGELDQKWWLCDAEGQVVGRLASQLAMVLMGKHRPTYTPHVDTGDYVVVINADKVKFTGDKLNQKIYYHHTGYPGGIKERKAGAILGGKFPERILEKAVERMLPKESPLARNQLTHLRIYNGATHPHEAQAPEAIDFKGMNAKNVRSA